ncbi:MAG: RNA polymerase sigma factor [Rhodobacteraceae bacterium]|nr:RNA polymerase sigma factor [Paracoccaceae bacterium]
MPDLRIPYVMTQPAASLVPSDDALLVLFANGDPTAARDLTGRLGPRAYGTALRMLGNRGEAQEVAQEAMLRLWRMAPNWQPGRAKVSTWLTRVVMNLCVDIQRRAQSLASGGMAALDDVAEPVDPGAGVVAGLLDSARKDALQAALMHLPERQRQAVILRHLQEMSNPEIAAVMDINVEAVESLTARGKRALVAVLAGRRDELGYDDD